jgi:peptidyl-prolyl cis-trans isomerase D
LALSDVVASGGREPYIPGFKRPLNRSLSHQQNGSMLRGIHKASSNWLGRAVMGVLLGLIAISFGIWGIGDIFRGFGQSTVAKIGGTEIRVEQFRQTYQDRLQQISRQVGRPVTPDQARALGIDRQMLAEVVAQTVLDERAKALKLGVTEQEVARRVMDDPTFRGLSGQFDRSRFEFLLRQIGYTEARYLAEQRRSMLRQQLTGTVGSELVPPKAAAEALNRYRNEQRSIDFVLLDRAQAGDVADPTPDVLTKYFEERKVLFRAPEYRKALLVTLTPAELAAGVEISDADLKKGYEERKARYATAERRQLQQIAFPNIEEAKAAAERIAKGTTFAALAAERGLKDPDIDLGTLAQSAMVDRAVADAAFALKQGEVSAPVEGRFGIVLVHVVKVEPSSTKPLEEVADELKKDMAAERSASNMIKLHDSIEDERLGGAALADIAKKLNLKTRTIEAIDRSGQGLDGKPVADLPQGIDLTGAIFRADHGSDNDPLTIPQRGGYVWYDVVEIKPARDRPLDGVKDQLVARWRDDQIAARLKAKADEMLEKVKAGTPFLEVAKANKLNPEWRPGLKRGNPPPGIPARALDEVFRTPKDAVATTEGASVTDRIVFVVTEITVPQLDPETDDAKRIDETLRRAMADDLLAQYVSRLETDIGVSINQAALNQVTGASPAN